MYAWMKMSVSEVVVNQPQTDTVVTETTDTNTTDNSVGSKEVQAQLEEFANEPGSKPEEVQAQLKELVSEPEAG